jgi:cytochrome c-type biogenesis protein CcmH
MLALLGLGAIIAIGAVWLVLRPVALDKHAGVIEQQHQLRLVRERLLAQLNEFDAEVGDRGVDPQVAVDERRRLEGELASVLRRLEDLETTPATEPVGDVERPPNWGMIAALAAALPLVAVMLFVGSNEKTLMALLLADSAPPASQQTSQQVPPMALQMVARLEKRLATQPDDAAGWAQLGRSYRVLNRLQDSKNAYAKAYTLAPDNVEIVSAYASLLYEENPQNTDGKVFELFSRLHTLDPTHPQALWFLGLAAYHRAQYARAAQLWQQLAAELPADSTVLSQLQHAIGEAQARLQKGAPRSN